MRRVCREARIESVLGSVGASALFRPSNGEGVNEFQKRIGVGERSRIGLKHKGTTRVTPVQREEGMERGTVGGKKIEHWDGRVDAVARPKPVKLTASRSERRIVNVES